MHNDSSDCSFLALIVRGQNLSLWNCGPKRFEPMLKPAFNWVAHLGFLARGEIFSKEFTVSRGHNENLASLSFCRCCGNILWLVSFHVSQKIKPLIQYSSFLCGPHLRQRSLWCSCTLLSRYHWERSPVQFS